MSSRNGDGEKLGTEPVDGVGKRRDGELGAVEYQETGDILSAEGDRGCPKLDAGREIEEEWRCCFIVRFPTREWSGSAGDTTQPP
ncbi:hypothetical protein CORC01_00762 [Colletotrichum orchidophilum]|uniref:Uncharacterized protein n=1 Tax=Colletotrichum orchidophilum TaxID=1209926 RepID=A0A1G4BR70_9PEZI|nr:uncharacterized protein CORC01_00762 [Colletotrichum orchidophilum]OHF03900.1 hypothetical protein CORC01_00762 [Colletotrichum orchidophilum]